MKTGNHVQDGRGRSFQVGQLLGRGMWGKCYLVREESNGAEWVLKVPLSEEEVSRDTPRLAEICREVIREQGRLLEESDNEALVAVESRFVADDGSPAFLMPRYPETLERRIANGCPFQEVLNIICEAVGALKTLSSTLPVHGNLHPGNILLTQDGSVRLMDPITPAVAAPRSSLSRRDGYNGPAYLPPEARGSAAAIAQGPTVDTYALATVLYRSAMATDDGHNAPPAIPMTGIQKQDLAVLKDRIHNRMKAEPSNHRFHTRLSDRASAIINRALSVETNPSPPYRFTQVGEFEKRLTEVRALVHPSITQVGKLILSRPPGSSGFDTDEDVRFSCSVGVSTGVETHEEIACGLAVFDTERNERLREMATSYTVDRHPSGRFRFSFRISDMTPGSYLVRVAFTIRDSGHEPSTAEGPFGVHAAAGYVPPRNETARQPIPMNRDEEVEEPENISQVDQTYNWDAEDTTGTKTATDIAPPEPVAVAASAVESVAPPTEPTSPTPRPLAPSKMPLPTPIESRPEPIPPTNPGIKVSDEPEYRGAGRWSELPLPSSQTQDLPVTERSLTEEAPKEQGPIGSAIGSLLELIRGDWFHLFLGGASLVIVLLLAALWLLP